MDDSHRHFRSVELKRKKKPEKRNFASILEKKIRDLYWDVDQDFGDEAVNLTFDIDVRNGWVFNSRRLAAQLNTDISKGLQDTLYARRILRKGPERQISQHRHRRARGSL